MAPGSDEQQARRQSAADAVQPPAGIRDQLLGFRSGEQHAEVERVQKLVFGEPAFFLDQDAVHDRDLAGRPPKLCAAIRLQTDRASRSVTVAAVRRSRREAQPRFFSCCCNAFA